MQRVPHLGSDAAPPSQLDLSTGSPSPHQRTAGDLSDAAPDHV
jgi:hypothetical protein